MLQLDDLLTVNRDAIRQEMAGEMIVVLPARGEFVVLNASGAYLLSHLQPAATLRQLAADLSARYGIPPDQAQTDTLAWANALLDAGVCCKE